MTVCIAALADNGNKVGLIADKLITFNVPNMPYQTEASGEKIFELTPDVKVMWCGGMVETAAILDRAKKSLGDKKWVTEIAEHVNSEHLKYLNEILERTHLRPRGIANIGEFYSVKNFGLLDDAKRAIDNALTTHWLQTNPRFIVCGKDSDGKMKIYSLASNPRSIPQFHQFGYATIGSGEMHATFSIIHSKNKYKMSLPLEEVKKILVEAKKKAEVTPDVGKETTYTSIG